MFTAIKKFADHLDKGVLAFLDDVDDNPGYLHLVYKGKRIAVPVLADNVEVIGMFLFDLAATFEEEDQPCSSTL